MKSTNAPSKVAIWIGIVIGGVIGHQVWHFGEPYRLSELADAAYWSGAALLIYHIACREKLRSLGRRTEADHGDDANASNERRQEPPERNQ